MWNKFLDWLTTSSADPNAYSATIQGILLHTLGLILPALIPVLSYLHIPFTVDYWTNVISISCQVLGIVLAVFGLLRKGYYMIKGLFVKKVPPATA